MTKLQQIQAFITKNAILSTAIMLLFVGTTTVSAMEVFNTPESKPSRILGINKPSASTSSNSTSSSSLSSVSNFSSSFNSQKIPPLVADSEHDVVVIEECDLAVKWEKTRLVKTQHKPIPEKLLILETRGNSSIQSPNNFFSISECSKSVPETYTLESKSDKYSYQKITNKEDFIKTIPFKEIQKETWIEPFFTNIKEMKFLTSKPGFSSPVSFEWQFVGKNNLYYSLDFVGYPSFDTSFGLSAIQFNSLAPSTPSVQLSQKPEISQNQNQLQNKIQPLVADSEHDVVVIEECDLAVRFEKSLNKTPENNYTQNGISFYTAGILAGRNLTSSLNIDCKNINFDEEKGGYTDTIVTNFSLFDETSKQNFLETKEKYTEGGNAYSGTFKNKIYLIKTKSKIYKIDFTSEGVDTMDKYSFQINSLAPASPSVSLNNDLKDVEFKVKEVNNGGLTLENEGKIYTVSQGVISRYIVDEIKAGDNLNITGKITKAQYKSGVDYYITDVIPEGLKIANSEVVELKDEELELSSYGKADYSLTKKDRDGRLLIFSIRRYGENSFDYETWQNKTISTIDLYGKVKISGKAVLEGTPTTLNKRYLITEITALEKVN